MPFDVYILCHAHKLLEARNDMIGVAAAEPLVLCTKGKSRPRQVQTLEIITDILLSLSPVSEALNLL